MDASADAPRRSFAFGLERVGFFGINAPYLTFLCIVLFSVLGVMGLLRLKVDDSLSELFRTDTEEFRRYEEIDRRFPSSEYDVLVVVEGKDLQGGALWQPREGLSGLENRQGAGKALQIQGFVGHQGAP